jgi:hypothetical protein
MVQSPSYRQKKAHNEYHFVPSCRKTKAHRLLGQKMALRYPQAGFASKVGFACALLEFLRAETINFTLKFDF